MDVWASRGRMSLKDVALSVLCFYAMAYPLVVQLFMKGTGSGTLIVQLFQILPILSLAYLWKFRCKTRSLRSYVDVWTVSLIYFTGAAVYFALFYVPENPFSEIVYSARFLSWFWLAATFRRIDLGPAFLERLAKSFWIGAISQCVIAFWGTLWGFRNGLASTYSNVSATTGSAEVSGKTVVAFVALGIALSVYWLLVKRRKKLLYATAIFLGISVVLLSYNRASQLGIGVAYCYVLLACLRKKKFKAAAALLTAACALGAFIASSYGNRFVARWETVVSDKGSGRVAMIEIAGQRLVDPPSSEVFWFGRGVFQMQEMMYEEIGSRIGMHNDLLDFTIAYGIVGAVLYLWVIYTVLNFHKGAPKYAIEKYFLSAMPIFVVLVGLCTGMFQATYVYFMLISTQYYLASQVRVKQALWEQACLENGAEWRNAKWERARYEDDDNDDWDDWMEDDEEAKGGGEGGGR